jgi:CcmD family protein
LAGWLIILLILTGKAAAQSENAVQMADGMRADGKIWVVVLVISIVFSGLFIFAFLTDRRLSKAEKEIKELKGRNDF